MNGLKRRERKKETEPLKLRSENVNHESFVRHKNMNHKMTDFPAADSCKRLKKKEKLMSVKKTKRLDCTAERIACNHIKSRVVYFSFTATLVFIPGLLIEFGVENK